MSVKRVKKRRKREEEEKVFISFVFLKVVPWGLVQ